MFKKLTELKEEKQMIVAKLQRCEKCGKMRGQLHMLSGETRIIDPAFITFAGLISVGV